jgi:hypothetical protein
MLELPLLQASGCFVPTTVAVLALPWFSAPCQGLHTTSPQASSLASSGWPCCPFWDWALPCSHFILDRACVVC